NSKNASLNGCENGAANQNGSSFMASDTVINLAPSSKEKPDPNNLVFGSVFTDHMLCIEWSKDGGWEKPVIKPFQNLSVHPAISAFHYAVQVSGPDGISPSSV
ncbi:hypothetical protein GDO86_019616, partial [Hymenochirus boettgeri]